MKKIVTTFALAAFCAMTASAQLADGFYRVQNKVTGRYISISDTDPNNYAIKTTTASVDMAGIRTIKSWERVEANPATIVYVKNIGDNKYDLEGQGTSLYKISKERLYIILTPQSDGTYKAKSDKYQGISLDIADGTDPDKEEDFLRNKSEETAYWKAVPVDTGSGYLGIEPDIKTADGYYGTIYAGFAFKLASSGMKLKEFEGETIPATMAVIIKCNSENPVDNKILPVTNGGAEPSDNMLRGVYCALTLSKHFNAKIYNPTEMRVIGTSGDKLAFVKASADDLVEGKYLQANKAYLPVEGADDVMTEDGTGIVTIKAEEKNSAAEGIYTLTGVRLPDGVTPKAGVYIKDGKKVVIK